MSIEILKTNIIEARRIVADLKKIIFNLKYANSQERNFYVSIINSFYQRLIMINNSVPDILNNISAVKKLNEDSVKTTPNAKENFVKISYNSSDSKEKSVVTLKREDREKFLKELSLSEYNIKKLGGEKKVVDLNKPSSVVEISNKVFGGISFKMSKYFDDLKKDLRDANSKFLLVTYLSMALFFSSLVFLISFVLLAVVFVFNPGAIMFVWVPFLLLFICLIGYYLYPSIQKSGVEQGIGSELPFATIYMASIAGSNIDPTRIFKIIADSSEYKNIGIEMKKIINQVEIYGYDLVTALKNVAKTTSNRKLSELLGGMATSISSGSSLRNFLEKNSENLLSDYKLERERYISVAGTYMDVYISILITAPVILVLVIVIMGLTDLKLGNFSVNSLVAMAIGAVVILNMFYLLFLQIKQPKT
jgi:Flp pilus assembly protein TadB